MSREIGPLWLLGCGNMGGALVERWLDAGLRDIAVIDPQARDLPGGLVAGAEPPAGPPPAVLVLAVKPQSWREAVSPLAERLDGTLILSVMAGTGCAPIASVSGGRAVVRAMPNMPARLGQGITALYGYGASAAQCDTAQYLMATAGATLWLDDEAQFDAVTAVSGSGPAYVFAFIEALAAAAEAAGLRPEVAACLARRTVTGAAALAAAGDATPATLRVAVTSPGGTTAAGLSVLMRGDALGILLRETVAAAQSRSRELSRSS